MHIHQMNIWYRMEEPFIIAQKKRLKQVEETDGGKLVEVEVLIEIGSS
jgi:hypothetical protein